MQKDNYTLLIEKLDAFIRKYYINQLLRGALYTVGAVLGLFIVFNVLEYYFYFGTTLRTIMLWSFLGLTGWALYAWVALPLMHYFHLGRVISHEQAASIIGQHFNNVQDKLLNILQLKQQSNNAIYAELINASINQKSEEIRIVPFQAAIDLTSNRKYLRYALPPVLLLLFLLLGAPNIIREGSMRLWNASTKYERPAPFRFVLNADTLRAVQAADYVLKVRVEGTALPNEAFINLGKVQYRMQKEGADEYSFKFVNVQRSTDFNFFAGGVESRDYTLAVAAKPNIVGFDVTLNYPAYLGRRNEALESVGDLVVPQGTNINWVFNAQSTESLSLRFGGSGQAEAKRMDDELFSYSHRAMCDEPYTVTVRNANVPGGDSVAYTITVVPDQHPQIGVQEFRDSTNKKALFFAGDASDDYGLSVLTFNYQIKKAQGGQLPMNTLRLDKGPGKSAQFDYTWDLRNIELQPGDEISYYFEVKDNDGVNGPKSARTGIMTFRLPSVKEMENQQAENSEEIKKDLEKAVRESLKVQEEIKKLRAKILQQKELDWQSRKELENLLNRQQQLQNQLEQAKQNFDENKQQQQEMQQQQSEQLQQKEEQLEKLFEEALSPEMKELMEEIRKLLEEMNKDEALEQMEKMQLNNEEMNKEMERLEELYKQLEVENMLEKQIEKLEELAKKEEELSEKTEQQKESNESLEKQQEELNKEFEDLKKKQEEMLEKNSELKKPQKIDDNKEEMKDIQKDMQDSKEQINKQQNKGASKKQKSAAGKMRDQANQMKQNSQAGQQQQMEEDMATLRQLLENLVGLSFAQEQNLKEVAGTTINTPRYVELAQQQYKIKDDFKLVEDSLQALASRNFQIESVITEKVTDVKASIQHAVEELEERRVPSANENQQQSMKGLNDLALMLSETMQQMQQAMAQMMPGSQSCQKPGAQGSGKDGKKPMDKITKGQGDLNQQMKDLKERLEKGKQEGGKQGGASSKELAQMAAKQAALRNALRELQKQKQQQGKGSQALDQIMQDMDKIETDLVNKRLTNETLKRQQEILTRLLEEERAERQQEQDEKREAEQARAIPPKMPPALEDYLRKRRAEIEDYRTVSPALKPYYKQLVEEYLKGGK